MAVPSTYVLIKGNAAWQFRSAHSLYRDVDQLADFIICIRGNGTVVLEKNRNTTEEKLYGKLTFATVEHCLNYIKEYYSKCRIHIEGLCTKIVDLTNSDVTVLQYIKRCHDLEQIIDLGIKELLTVG